MWESLLEKSSIFILTCDTSIRNSDCHGDRRDDSYLKLSFPVWLDNLYKSNHREYICYVPQAILDPSSSVHAYCSWPRQYLWWDYRHFDPGYPALPIKFERRWADIIEPDSQALLMEDRQRHFLSQVPLLNCIPTTQHCSRKPLYYNRDHC